MIVACPYQEKCVDYHSELCKTCKKNNNRSYYEPVQESYYFYPLITPSPFITYHYPPITPNPSTTYYYPPTTPYIVANTNDTISTPSS